MTALDLQPHLDTGATHICRCWALRRRDGTVLGFTDHDLTLSFDGIDYVANSGLSARALETASGLAVDNSEALGALSGAFIRDEDIAAGLYDGATVEIWQVRWDDPQQRRKLFKGFLGDITRQGGGFQAELRGLGELLNIPREQVFQKMCNAVLGDARCGVDLSDPAFSALSSIADVEPGPVLVFDDLGAYPERWFEYGLIRFPGKPLAAGPVPVREDVLRAGRREISLWRSPDFGLAPGDQVALAAGCDRRFTTCRNKFQNGVNFRGHPHLPGDDWVSGMARKGGANSGGSMNT